LDVIVIMTATGSFQLLLPAYTLRKVCHRYSLEISTRSTSYSGRAYLKVRLGVRVTMVANLSRKGFPQ